MRRATLGVLSISCVLVVLSVLTWTPEQHPWELHLALPDVIQPLPCNTTWQEEYTALHRHILSLPPGHADRKTVIFRCTGEDKCGGQGDRYVGLISSFFIALMMKRAFVVWWDGLDVALHSPLDLDFHSAFPNDDFGLSPRKFSKNNDWMACSDWNCVVEDQDVLFWNWHNVFQNTTTRKPWIEHADLQQRFPQRTLLFRSNRGITAAAFRNPLYGPMLRSMGLSPTTAFGCFFDFLLRPTPAVSSLFGPYQEPLRDPATLVIGMHIRTGDAVMQKPGQDGSEVSLSDFQQYVDCANKLKSEWQQRHARAKVKWMLLSDSEKLRKEAMKVYPDLVLPLVGALGHTDPRFINIEETSHKVNRTETFLVAVGENYYLAECDYFVVGVSGYSMTAIMRSRRQSVYRVASRYTKSKHGSGEIEHLPCTLDGPFTPIESVYKEGAHV